MRHSGMKRRDVAAIVMAAAVVGAAGMKDWSPKTIAVRATVVSSEDEGGPERLRREVLDRVRDVRWTGGRDLFRYVEKRLEVFPIRGVEGTHASASVHAAAAGQATNNDVLPHIVYFGFAKKSGVQRAMFYDDEQVYLAKEGDVIGGRYRVVRIGITAAEIEDLARHTLETLAMVTS
jgi:hypothetical protein